MKAILLDIEGTTTPIDFVHKTLFPFAEEKIGEYVRENFAGIKEEIAQLEMEYRRDFSGQIYGRDFDRNSPAKVSAYLAFLMEIDRKSTPLKSLQGKIWKEGYETGELKSEVFADVPPAFECWRDEGKTIAIYSSGSVLAQKLLFEYTGHGDLTPFIAAYFDTNTGHKKEPESYRKIVGEMSFPQVENFLFISDVVAELDAAEAAGMETLLSIRAGNAPVSGENSHRSIRSFDEI
jgi:enolase-phosphatase E1